MVYWTCWTLDIKSILLLLSYPKFDTIAIQQHTVVVWAKQCDD